MIIIIQLSNIRFNIFPIITLSCRHYNALNSLIQTLFALLSYSVLQLARASICCSAFIAHSSGQPVRAGESRAGIVVPVAKNLLQKMLTTIFRSAIIIRMVRIIT